MEENQIVEEVLNNEATQELVEAATTSAVSTNLKYAGAGALVGGFAVWAAPKVWGLIKRTFKKKDDEVEVELVPVEEAEAEIVDDKSEDSKEQKESKKK